MYVADLDVSTPAVSKLDVSDTQLGIQDTWAKTHSAVSSMWRSFLVFRSTL